MTANLLKLASKTAAIASIALGVGAVSLIDIAPAKAEWNSQTFGNSTYYNGNINGTSYSGTTTRFGNSSYHYGTDSNGNSYSSSCSTFGNSTYCF